MSTSLQSLWSMIEAQQLIVLLPLMDIKLAAISAIMIGKLTKVANFDIIEIGDYWEELFEMPEVEALTENFEAVGMETSFFIYNVGTMVISIIYIVVMSIFVSCLDRCR